MFNSLIAKTNIPYPSDSEERSVYFKKNEEDYFGLFADIEEDGNNIALRIYSEDLGVFPWPMTESLTAVIVENETGNETKIPLNFNITMSEVPYGHVAQGIMNTEGVFIPKQLIDYTSGQAEIFVADEILTHVAVYSPRSDFKIERASCDNGSFTLKSLNDSATIFESSTAMVGINASFTLDAAEIGGMAEAQLVRVQWDSE